MGAIDLSRAGFAARAVPRRLLHCAGGHDGLRTKIGSFLPTEIRNRLLRRGLAFQPDAMVANGDHVYWDLLAPRASPVLGASPEAVKLAGTFHRAAIALGGKNEAVLKLAAGQQIVPVYGTDFRSTPMFFLQHDHDYFDNDEATDEIVTFPVGTEQLCRPFPCRTKSSGEG